MGRHGEAFAPLVKATQLDPTFAEAFYEIGYAYLRGTDFEKSLPFFRSAIRLNPEYGDAYYGLGQAYAQLGKGDLARTQLGRLKAVDPKLALKLEREIPTTLANAEAERAMLAQAASAETPPSPVSGTVPPASVDQSAATEPQNLESRNSSPTEPSATADTALLKTRPRQLQVSPKIESDRPTNLSGPTAQSNRVQNRRNPEASPTARDDFTTGLLKTYQVMLTGLRSFAKECREL